MSKSRGTYILADTYLRHLDPQYLRYYFASKLTNGIEDIDLNFDDFIQKTNSDVVGKYINLASRSSNFINKYFNNKLAKIDSNHELLSLSKQLSKSIYAHYENREFSKAIKDIMTFADKTNQFFDNKTPWDLIKDDNKHQEVHEICTLTLIAFKNISIFLSPILPNLYAEVLIFLNLDDCGWKGLENNLSGHKINKYDALFTRIDKETVEKIKNESKE